MSITPLDEFKKFDYNKDGTLSRFEFFELLDK